MNKRILIALSFFALLSLCDIAGKQALASTPEAAIVRTHEAQNTRTSFPYQHSGLFAIHQQAEIGLISSKELFDFAPNNNKNEYDFRNLFGESGFQGEALAYLVFTKKIPLILTVKKLIFPFHSFL